MVKTNLNFHQTFKPERQYISSILTEAKECDGLDVQNISNKTGIPTGQSSGKVEPAICYAEYMGLIKKEKHNGKYSLSYTMLGECIKEEDAGILEKLSLLAMHAMIVRQYSGAELWKYIFQHVFPKYRNRLTVNQFEKEIEIQFGQGVKIAPFKGCYQEFFSQLCLLKFDDDQVILNVSKIDLDFVYLYAYVLFTYWDEWLKNESEEVTLMASQTEITADHLRRIGFRHPFGWDEKDEYKVLELMAMKKLIVLNRQMVPFTIRRTSDFDYVLEMLYSELC